MFSFMKVYGYKIVVMHVNSIFFKTKRKSIHVEIFGNAFEGGLEGSIYRRQNTLKGENQLEGSYFFIFTAE